MNVAAGGAVETRNRVLGVIPEVSVIAGGGLGIVGSALPWWRVSARGFGFSLTAWESGLHSWIGWACAILATGLLAIGVVALSRPGGTWFSLGAVLCALAMCGTAIAGLSAWRTFIGHELPAFRFTHGFGPGMFVVLVGAPIAAVGGALGRKPRAAKVPAPPAQTWFPPQPFTE